MDYSSIENLSQEQITKLYNDIIENDTNISCTTYWFVTCTNGRSGYFCEDFMSRSRGHCDYLSQSGNPCPEKFNPICTVCGSGRYGYACAQ